MLVEHADGSDDAVVAVAGVECAKCKFPRRKDYKHVSAVARMAVDEPHVQHLCQNGAQEQRQCSPSA